MEFSEFISYLLIFIVGFAFGWIQRERVAMNRVETLLRHFDDIPHGEEVSDDRDDYIRINVEKHGAVIFLYNAETDEFVGQGTTKEEITSALKRKYPGGRFAVEEAGITHLESLS
jgi:hypothetical protein